MKYIDSELTSNKCKIGKGILFKPVTHLLCGNCFCKKCIES